jgi:hypothetical protein
MRKTTPARASIAIVLFCAAMAACETKLPMAERESRSSYLLPDYQLPGARVCQVNAQGCLTMSPEPAHACLTAADRCPVTGSVQSLELVNAGFH